MKNNDSSTIATRLAETTSAKAVELAASATATAAALASKTAESTAEIRTDISWMKQSLSNIQNTLKEMVGMYITKPIFDENQKMTDDHEERLRIVEQRIQIWAGGLLILSFAIPILAKMFFK